MPTIIFPDSEEKVAEFIPEPEVKEISVTEITDERILEAYRNWNEKFGSVIPDPE